MGENKKTRDNPFLSTARPLLYSPYYKKLRSREEGEGEGGGKQALSQLQMKTAKDAGSIFLSKPHFRGRTHRKLQQYGS